MKKPLILLCLLIVVVTHVQAVPELINYQGKFMDGTNLYNGTVPITFNLYAVESGSHRNQLAVCRRGPGPDSADQPGADRHQLRPRGGADQADSLGGLPPQPE